MHSPSKAQFSDFDYRVSFEQKGSHQTRNFVERQNRIYNSKSTTKPFNTFKSIGYSVDPYERKESLKREERYKHFEKLRDLAPFRNAGSQSQAFTPEIRTYGCDVAIPIKNDKVRAAKLKPMYGPFKKGDDAHTGVNGTFGGAHGDSRFQYVEERTRDRVVRREEPSWTPPEHMLRSVPVSSIVSHFRNQDIE